MLLFPPFRGEGASWRGWTPIVRMLSRNTPTPTLQQRNTRRRGQMFQSKRRPVQSAGPDAPHVRTWIRPVPHAERPASRLLRDPTPPTVQELRRAPVCRSPHSSLVARRGSVGLHSPALECAEDSALTRSEISASQERSHTLFVSTYAFPFRKGTWYESADRPAPGTPQRLGSGPPPPKAISEPTKGIMRSHGSQRHPRHPLAWLLKPRSATSFASAGPQQPTRPRWPQRRLRHRTAQAPGRPATSPAASERLRPTAAVEAPAAGWAERARRLA